MEKKWTRDNTKECGRLLRFTEKKRLFGVAFILGNGGQSVIMDEGSAHVALDAIIDYFAVCIDKPLLEPEIEME